jgi:hypothetical protein
MGTIVGHSMIGSGIENRLFHDNHKDFERKVHSQYAKYLKELPFFTDYFHLIKAESTYDTGLMNIDKLTGEDSPLRYNLIKDFPLYGMDQILADLDDDEDIGFQTNYEGEAIILPQTIIPLPDDHFSITAVGKRFFFRVTEIHYDTILDRNYYKINFVIKAVDNQEYYDDFIKRTNETFVCVYNNYGTQDAFIIKEANYNIGEKLQKLADSLMKKYMMLFYNENYNALVVKKENGYGYHYDAFVNYFCNEQEIFAQNIRNLWNYKFYEEKRPEFYYLYTGNSIQSAFINKDIDLLNSPRFYRYFDEIPSFTDSIFQFYGDYDTSGVTISERKINLFGKHNKPIVSEELIDSIIHNRNIDKPDLIYNVLVCYMNNNDKYVGELFKEFEGDIKIRPTYENYVLVPIFLYVLFKYKRSITSETHNFVDFEMRKQSSNVAMLRR